MIDTSTFLRHLRGQFKPRKVTIDRPQSEFPELVVRVPDAWPYVELAPWYDVHRGHKLHDAPLFAKHRDWFLRSPYTLGWNGGDFIENSSKLSVGGGVYEQDETPNEQVYSAMESMAGMRHKLLFAIPGNHEQRAGIVGLDAARWMATALEMPYFVDYCMCVIEWRDLRYRILAHHGSGAATTAGAQRMAARKDISWANPFDLFWTGHLHNPLVDVLYQTDADQKHGGYFERNGFVIISPSYLSFFGSYGAVKRYHPGTRGLGVVRLNDDGRMDCMMHARGRRL